MVVVKSRVKDSAFVPVSCPYCQASLEYLPPASSSSSTSSTSGTTTPTSTSTSPEFEIECAKCAKTWGVKHQAKPNASAAGGSTKTRKGRTIGSDERPLDTSYYDILGLPVTCTTDEVKKAYRRLAIKSHPDKNPNDPTAADRFKEIAIAYTTLSDPALRHTYNEFGKSKNDGGDADAMVDPEAIFSTLFGGERFQDIIGTISLGSEMKSAMQEAEDDEDEPSVGTESFRSASANPATPGSSSSTVSTSTAAKPALSPEQQAAQDRKKQQKEEQERKVAEEKARVRDERVKALSVKLRDKLALFSEQAVGEEDKQIADGVRTMWSIEAEELKKESYGVELLHTVGFVYQSKSKHFLASTGPIPFGVGGWFHSAKSTAHIFNQTVSTVRSAYALKDVFDAIQKAEESGVSAEEKKKLEDKAAQMGLHALFKGAKLEVESVIREVCDRVLSSTGVEEPTASIASASNSTAAATANGTTTVKVPLSTLRKRAVALGILGDVFSSVVKDPNQESPFGPGFPAM
ncbi:hypothetical protein JCM10212_005101 [Sporobolomyces blumeae]